MTLVRFNTQPSFPGVLEHMLFKPAGLSGNVEPLVNIINQENAFIVEIAVPGYSKEEISINLEQQMLKINAEAKLNETGDNKYLRREFSLNGINRRFTLPKSIDTENIVADFHDGILKITLPRKQEEVIRKEISIS
ncbi:MAG: Hsp20/alpha crystallin family protein [Bacteroidota bacterium]